MNKYTLDVPADENDKYSGVRNMMNTLVDIDWLAQYEPSIYVRWISGGYRIMKKDYKIAVAGTGARDIIGSTKKTYDN